jgi:hypothetical protein
MRAAAGLSVTPPIAWMAPSLSLFPQRRTAHAVG